MQACTFRENVDSPEPLPELSIGNRTRRLISHSGPRNCAESSLDSMSADTWRQSNVIAVLKATSASCCAKKHIGELVVTCTQTFFFV